MNLKWKKRIARITGTWGISFFSPLVSANTAETIFHIGLTFEMTIVIALVASIFQLGLGLSQELKDFGKGM